MKKFIAPCYVFLCRPGVSRQIPGIDFPFEKPYLLTRASPQDDARSKANSLKTAAVAVDREFVYIEMGNLLPVIIIRHHHHRHNPF